MRCASLTPVDVFRVISGATAVDDTSVLASLAAKEGRSREAGEEIKQLSIHENCSCPQEGNMFCSRDALVTGSSRAFSLSHSPLEPSTLAPSMASSACKSS